MRQAHKVWTGIAAAVFAVVAITDLATGGDPSADERTTGRAAAAAPREPLPAPAPAPSAIRPAADDAADDAAGTTVVASVVDGDTFTTADGRTIQIIAIDACEAGTYGGDLATESARILLVGETVALTTAPGVDLDRHGNELRHVALSWVGDVAETLVVPDHTAVFEGHGAPAGYVSELRVHDYGTQQCEEPVVAESPSGGGDVDIDRPSPGDQGLPDGALTGGFCARKWWC